jgi:hypothetical protein
MSLIVISRTHTHTHIYKTKVLLFLVLAEKNQIYLKPTDAGHRISHNTNRIPDSNTYLTDQSLSRMCHHIYLHDSWNLSIKVNSSMQKSNIRYMSDVIVLAAKHAEICLGIIYSTCFPVVITLKAKKFWCFGFSSCFTNMPYIQINTSFVVSIKCNGIRLSKFDASLLALNYLFRLANASLIQFWKYSTSGY